MTRFAFLADPQLGCRATFSGLDAAGVESLRRRDMHVTSFPPTDGHEWETSQLEKAITAVNEQAPDFVVVGGDMIDDARSEAQRQSLLGAVDDLDASIPLHWVPGNHDCAFDGQQPTLRSLAHYEALFGSDTYAFQADDASFVVLNTSVLHRPERVPELCEQQLEFVRRELRSAARRAAPIVLFGHHPLFLHRRDEADSYWNLPRRPRQAILDAVDEYGVTTMFAGHYHRNQVTRDGRFEMVTSGPVGFPLGSDPSGYRIVEIDGDVLTHSYHPLDPA